MAVRHMEQDAESVRRSDQSNQLKVLGVKNEMRRYKGIRLTVTYFTSSYDTLLKDHVVNLATSGSCSRWEFHLVSSTCFSMNYSRRPSLP